VTIYDKVYSRINLLETLPEDTQVLYCLAHKFLSSEEAEMFIAQRIIPCKDGTLIIPTVSTSEY